MIEILDELERRDRQTGVVTLCVGGGICLPVGPVEEAAPIEGGRAWTPDPVLKDPDYPTTE